MVLRRAGPLEAAFLDARVGDAAAGFPPPAYFVPDLFRRVEIKKLLFPHSARHGADNLPIGLRVSPRFDHFPHALHAPLRVHERAVLFEARSGGEKKPTRTFLRSR